MKWLLYGGIGIGAYLLLKRSANAAPLVSSGSSSSDDFSTLASKTDNECADKHWMYSNQYIADDALDLKARYGIYKYWFGKNASGKCAFMTNYRTATGSGGGMKVLE